MALALQTCTENDVQERWAGGCKANDHHFPGFLQDLRRAEEGCLFSVTPVHAWNTLIVMDPEGRAAVGRGSWSKVHSISGCEPCPHRGLSSSLGSF